MNEIKKDIIKIAERYGIQIIYAFGSRAKEALFMVEGEIQSLTKSTSDLDIGIKPEHHLTIEEKVEIALLFEDLFNVQKVDVVIIPEAPISLALDIVTGEILYAQDLTYEAEYQLYIMRLSTELQPYEQNKKEMVLGG